MNSRLNVWLLGATLGIAAGIAPAIPGNDTVKLFQDPSQSSDCFHNSDGYTVFPTIGKSGIGVGAVHGSCHVCEQGKRVGRVTMNQLSVRLQPCSKAFTEGGFEFSGDIGAVAITASAVGKAV